MKFNKKFNREKLQIKLNMIKLKNKKLKMLKIKLNMIKF